MFIVIDGMFLISMSILLFEKLKIDFEYRKLNRYSKNEEQTRAVSNISADQANKAKLILLLGGFNNTGELESQLKGISVPPSCFKPLHV